jgi:hypothetical protein
MVAIGGYVPGPVLDPVRRHASIHSPDVELLGVLEAAEPDAAVCCHHLRDEACAPQEGRRVEDLEEPEVGAHGQRRDDTVTHPSPRHHLRDVQLALLEAVPIGDAHQHVVEPLAIHLPTTRTIVLNQ